jgi:dephospho-CoA kinase
MDYLDLGPESGAVLARRIGMLTVALTGGIGSGKSEVARLFSARGVPVIDTDILARELVKPGQPALKEIRETFGAHMVTANDELDRVRLAALCFSNPDARKQLESILHPRIRQDIADQLFALKAAYALIVIPLLIETGQQNEYDRVLVVDCPPEVQRQRVRQRDKRADDQIDAIMSAQASRTQRLQAAADVIRNDGELSELEQQVESLHRKYLALSQSRA